MRRFKVKTIGGRWLFLIIIIVTIVIVTVTIIIIILSLKPSLSAQTLLSTSSTTFFLQPGVEWNPMKWTLETSTSSIIIHTINIKHHQHHQSSSSSRFSLFSPCMASSAFEPPPFFIFQPQLLFLLRQNHNCSFFFFFFFKNPKCSFFYETSQEVFISVSRSLLAVFPFLTESHFICFSLKSALGSPIFLSFLKWDL